MGQPVKIVDLAERIIRLSGLEPGRDIQITFTGIRPGERLNEILFAREEETVDIGIPGIVAAKPVRPSLEAAVRNELVGPVETEDGFALIAVADRCPPDAADGELRRRAEILLAERATQRAIHAWVEWKDSALR